MKQISLIALLFITNISFSQTSSIEGTVYDENNNPLVGANIYIKGSYFGATSDTNGYFILKYTKKDSTNLVVSFIGYQVYETNLSSSKTTALKIKMIPDTDLLDEVIITAGTFEASDKKRAVLLDAIDIATTASAEGDIYGALSTFPGATKQGETGKIIVRGGEAHETKTYMDGMLVSSPYSSNYPDLPSRGRFTPFMFNGVVFSTGGYSAEYGQALSSVLELQTPGLFDKTITSLSIMNVGLGLSHTHRGLNSAVSAEANYNNLTPYFLMAKHKLDWAKTPESANGNIKYRIKIGKTGLLKTYAGYNYSNSKLNYSMNGNGSTPIKLTNKNLFLKTVYNTEIKENWLFKTGIAYNSNLDNTSVKNAVINDRLSSLHARLGFQNFLTKKLNIRYGTEVMRQELKFTYKEISSDETFPLNTADNLFSGYFEMDAMLGKKTAIRAGVRSEHSTLSNQQNIAPRLSMAYKINKMSQLSLAYGNFYQQAQTDYLKYTSKLLFENAEHYILNYQYQKNSRLFRTEIYYKNYNNLITYTPGELEEFQNITNDGSGFARGIDVFWRDKKTFKFIDYWISYSFIDTKRKYKDYLAEATPDFVSKHNFSAVYKQWIPSLNSQLSLTYSFASGRSYNNPANEVFMNEQTSPIHDLSGSISYVTSIFDKFTVVHLSVNNILGLDKIYSYKFIQEDASSNFSAVPVKSMIQRTIILGVFISFN
jgi:hypothetical protein